MVDLNGQMNKIRDEVQNAINQVLDSCQFIKGPAVNVFENELSTFTNIPYVTSCGNGSDAIKIALMALDIPKGSEVLVPSFNFVAAAEMIALLGYQPVFVDADYDNFNISITSLKQNITSSTKAIVIVHLFGTSNKMDEILQLAEENDLYIIEDNAQSFGASYKEQLLGSIGHISTTSFFPSKNLSCAGDGGAIFTNDETLSRKIRSIANHGQEIKYNHKHIGINSRLDTVQAAILNVKIQYYPDYLDARKRAALQYNSLLKGSNSLILPTHIEDADHIYHQYTVKVKNNQRDDLRQFLSKHEIPTMVYYPTPLHLQPAYLKFASKTSLPVSEQLSDEVISLPIHTELQEDQITFICDKIKEFIK